MKNKLYFLAVCIFLINTTMDAQYANKTLSNLTTPVAVNQNLLPATSGSKNLGSTTKQWNSLFVKNGIFLNKQLEFIDWGYSNLSVGYSAGLNISGRGVENLAVGEHAMEGAEYGSGNTIIGNHAFEYGDEDNNTAVGYSALYLGWDDYDDVAIGAYVLYNNKYGSANTSIGNYSLHNNIKGNSNVAAGFSALYSDSAGSENVAIGDSAAYAQNTGVYMNTAIGARALRHNIKGTANTACGSYTLYHNKATNNSAFGNASLIENTTGANNSAFGNSALYNNSTGSYNTAFGNNAGDNITTGSNNTFLGYNANSGSQGAGNNMMALGNGATVTSNNHVVIGNSSITSIGGYANWSNLSDGRVKKNIKQNVPGLAFINKLQPITYNLDLDVADKILNAETKNKSGKIVQPSQGDITARKTKEQIIYTGFVAQDVEKAAQSLNYDFSGVDKPDNANTLYGLRYSDFVVPLVKAVQELSKMNDAKDSVINALKYNYDEKIDLLQNQIDELKTMIVSKQLSVNSEQLTANSSTSLSQNIPNPFSNSTTINYSLPSKFLSAKIIITDKSGNTLKQINLSSNKGSVTVNAATLSSGAYQYSLYVDGKLIATKQMEHIK